MEYAELSKKAKGALKIMVGYCVVNGLCMGMDEGKDLSTDIEHDFVQELRRFVRD